MNKNLIILFVCLFLCPFSFAEDISNIDGGSCSYVDTYGKAEIISIKQAGPESYNCKNAVEVLFNFTPDDPNAIKHYKMYNWPDTNRKLTVSAGINPSREMVEKKGIKVGKIYRCIRQDIVQGTCTPVIFRVPDIDFTDTLNYCW